MFKVEIKYSSEQNAFHRFFSRCKVCYCDEHIKRRGFKYTAGEAYPCPKCNYPTRETKDLSMSSKSSMITKFWVENILYCCL